MNKNKIIKLMITIVIIVIIIIVLIIYFINKENLPNPPQNAPEDLNINRTVEEVSVTNDYFIVKNIINKYYSYCRKLNTTITDINSYEQGMSAEEIKKYKEEKAIRAQEIAQEGIYSMLDTSYINEFNITKEIIEKRFKIKNQFESIIEKIYVMQDSLNVSCYLVYGFYIDMENFEKTEFSLAVNIDMLNNTFSIYPHEYLEKHGYNEIKVGDTVIFNTESIDNKEYNTFEYKFIEDNTIAKEYFNNYKYAMLYSTDNAYKMLDKEYREKRFGSLEKYKKYVKENFSSLKKCSITKYQTEKSYDINNYICLDNFGNYYIFKSTSISNYTLKLDTYTIEDEKFKKEYNNADEAKKVQMNIDKFIQMINSKDYENSYNLLYDGFKNNYFKTEEKYIKYIKDNFFEYNKVIYNNITNQGDTYIYNITLLDKTSEENINEKSIDIIMKLEDNTNFVMSFSIN